MEDDSSRDGWAEEQEMNFEFMNWSDVTEAEFSGDQQAIERLMNQSQEMRRQHSMSETPKSSEPTTPCLISTPNDLPFANFYNNKEDIDPNIVNSAPSKSMRAISTPFSSRNTLSQSKRTSSYAQITRGAGKVGKRRTNERVGLSPIDLPRRKNFRQLFSPPSVRPMDHSATPDSLPMTTPDPLPMTTPDPLPITSELDEINLNGVDTSTPETDRLMRGGGVQRRLFGGQTSSPQQEALAVSQDKQHKLPNGCPPPWFPQPNQDKLCDVHRLAQRQKQIDMGKETVGYERYSQLIPKWKRGRGHPWTPDKYSTCSTRAWQGQMKQWRRNLHKFDPPLLLTMSAPPAREQQFTSEDAQLCGLSIDCEENPIEI